MSVIVPLEELPFSTTLAPMTGPMASFTVPFTVIFCCCTICTAPESFSAHKDSGWLATSPVQSNKAVVALRENLKVSVFIVLVLKLD